jgi:hypothetical protein
MTNPYPVENDRLIIRPFMLDDAEDLHGLSKRLGLLLAEPRGIRGDRRRYAFAA